MKRNPRDIGAPPDAARLREAALAHLARFAATEAGLARVLGRRVDRWVRAAESAGLAPDSIAQARRDGRAAIPLVIAALRDLGALNDTTFAESRARRLAREGHSRRAALVHLAMKGVDQDIAAEALPESPERDLAAACTYLRRRRLPPFAGGEALRMKALAALARGGFDRDIAERALALDADSAETLVIALRQGTL
ncbi:regulatory protein RecX [Acidiphilium iwatense]|uniref:Regulatory protein RecX n=1 Tax=Acidiphilium iwatense TaxID=768198 RepID=A0ABS9DYV5_9PROT|nr:RecX family transcriptional regulator [Acidiphilium iwatense]MCF3947944.1 RecX family transcriptional regulator [Acidiphilium iwatense]